MQLKQRHASMHLQQPQADMQVKAANGQLHVDNSAVRQDLGVGSQLQMAKEQARASIRTAQQGAARRAREGDRMMREPNVIGTIAKETNYSRNHVETNVGLIPRSRPEIAYVGEPTARVHVIPQAPRLEVIPQPPELQVTQAAVEAYLKQKGSVKIEYIGPRGIWA
ncbi:MAG: hypothetical protein GX060_05385 [Firmicutes bacterium]|nr:hypothetical protein [Bacillota bacterium]